MLKRYDVIIGGSRTTLQLSDADAKARGLTDANPSTDQAEVTEVKARVPANKSRRPVNKSVTAKG